MQDLRLRIVERGIELPLHEGAQTLRGEAGDWRFGADDQNALVRFCVDRRGVWLNVIDNAVIVHVNGRQVRQMALLRPGDAIHLDGSAMLLASGPVPEPAQSVMDEPEQSNRDDLRVLLRAIGGRHHGRSFTLDQPRLVGRVAEADIRIDDPAFAERHAQVTQVGGQVILRDLGSTEGCVVNGWPVRDAVLQPGDQVVFDGQYRFVLEGSAADLATTKPPLPDEAQELVAAVEPSQTWRRWPWLLLAALLLGGALAALLLLGGA